MKRIAIFGAGGFGREVKWLIDEINAVTPTWDFIGYYDDDFSTVKNIDSSLFLGGTAELNDRNETIALVFAVGNPLVKRKIIQNIQNPALYYPTLIHPNVCMGKANVMVGEGSIICAGTILTIDIKIGRHVIINLCCTVGHDSLIGDFCSFMPAVNISGEVSIGEGVYVGTGAKIINQLEIGEETIIGAGAVVAKSLPAKCTAVGIPAKPVKFN
ncbi:MAG: acetyltransferase [Ferruginibacter sp.]|nr:acetyltransferase [Ferruginibacter sp.]